MPKEVAYRVGRYIGAMPRWGKVSLLMLLVFGLARTCGPTVEHTQPTQLPPPARTQSPSPEAQAAEAGRIRKECSASIEDKKRAYAALMKERRFWSAALSLRTCAQSLGTPELATLVRDAEISSHLADINNLNLPPRERAGAIEMLARDYPDVGSKYEPLAPKLLEAADSQDKWSYHHADDSMTRGVVHEATVWSSNTVDFAFPYSGIQHGKLTLRNHPRYGRDVIFRIEKGQMLCSSFEGCNVVVRFDDESPTNYSASGPEDQSSEVLFIRNYDKFFRKMLKARRVRIAVNIYHEGAPMFEFDVGGFQQGKYTSAE